MLFRSEDELNVENVELLSKADEYVSYELKPQLKTLGPKYGKNLGAIRQYLSSAEPIELVNTVRNGEKVKFNVPDGSEIEIGEEDLLITLKNKEGYSSDSNGDMTVVLDTTLNEHLIEEGIVAEFVSKVQNLRKDSGLEVVNHIKVEISGDEKLIEILDRKKDNFTKTLLADSFARGNNGDFSSELTFEEKLLNIYISRV